VIATGNVYRVEIIHNGPVPPYRQIAAQLRERIEAGEFTPDVDPLPSLKQIVQETGVAVTTAIRAYRLLQDEGLVYSAPGRGWYVQRPGT
jgi:DNA-binding GntR family transcriptional regulator